MIYYGGIRFKSINPWYVGTYFFYSTFNHGGWVYMDTTKTKEWNPKLWNKARESWSLLKLILCEGENVLNCNNNYLHRFEYANNIKYLELVQRGLIGINRPSTCRDHFKYFEKSLFIHNGWVLCGHHNPQVRNTKPLRKARDFWGLLKHIQLWR